jgi:predicted RNase H-like HicB family nuclease
MSKKYTATVVRDGRWWAVSVPALRGVHTQGRDLDDAQKMACEAAALWLDIDASEVEIELRGGRRRRTGRSSSSTRGEREGRCRRAGQLGERRRQAGGPGHEPARRCAVAGPVSPARIAAPRWAPRRRLNSRHPVVHSPRSHDIPDDMPGPYRLPTSRLPLREHRPSASPPHHWRQLTPTAAVGGST